MLYKIVRNYFNGGSQGSGKNRRVIERGLTLEQAQAYCHDKEGSSSTCLSPEGRRRTRIHGAWFDSYTEDR